MGSLLQQAAADQVLLDAWDTVRSSALEDGIAGPEVERFEPAAARKIADIGLKLRSGSWQPRPARHLSISKRTGGRRNLAIPALEDRIVERALLSVLDPLIDPILMPWCVAYRRGLGVDDAVRALTEARDIGAAWVARCDVKDCFESLPRWRVITRLSEVCPDLELVDLVRAFVYRPVVGAGAPRRRGRGLHQGSPLSPLLANLYLDTFDRELLAAGLQPIRFADDVAIPAESRAAGEIALARAADAARNLDLELNLGKSTVVSFDEGVEFLGRTVTATTGAGKTASAHPLETTVYVSHQGALLRSRGERAVVMSGAETLARINLRRIRQVVLFGRVGMTTAFIHQVLSRGIDVVLLEEDGRYVGRFHSTERATTHVRSTQYHASRKTSDMLRIGRCFVRGKVQNMRVMLLRLERRHGDLGFGPAIRRLDRARVQVDEICSIPELMGVEGAATREYFQLWQRLLDPIWEFQGRRRRPPPDPINAMLSFGYTLLANEGVSAAASAGLDPYVGLLHQAHRGRAGIALDLIEELRPVIVDSVAFDLVSRGRIRPTDFDTTEERGCRLTDAARRQFVAAYERRMLQLITYQDSGRRISYRVALHQQARSLVTALEERGAYRPILWK
jgi:CRISPR-associated protein Cas1